MTGLLRFCAMTIPPRPSVVMGAGSVGPDPNQVVGELPR
jgi:hypothetical protein